MAWSSSWSRWSAWAEVCHFFKKGASLERALCANERARRRNRRRLTTNCAHRRSVHEASSLSSRSPTRSDATSRRRESATWKTHERLGKVRQLTSRVSFLFYVCGHMHSSV